MAKFFKAELVEIGGNVFDHVFPKSKGDKQFTMADRMGNENGECEMCGENEWWLYPKESVMVANGGKQYIECLGCGHVTHL